MILFPELFLTSWFQNPDFQTLQHMVFVHQGFFSHLFPSRISAKLLYNSASNSDSFFSGICRPSPLVTCHFGLSTVLTTFSAYCGSGFPWLQNAALAHTFELSPTFHSPTPTSPNNVGLHQFLNTSKVCWCFCRALGAPMSLWLCQSFGGSHTLKSVWRNSVQ